MDHIIDLNSDIGESYGAWRMGDDEGVLASVTSANVAAGFHAGDPVVMKKTISLCAKTKTSIGAHISYPDVMGFGRRAMACSPDEIYSYCLYQIGAVQAFCRANGVSLSHVKPHGALYNSAAKDRASADAIAHAVRDAGGDLILLGLAGSRFEDAARDANIKSASEAFADRAYMADGSLMPRSMKGSVIHDLDEAASRVVSMATRGVVKTADGGELHLSPDSICLHGDTAEAVEMSRAVRDALERAGVKIAPLAEVIANKERRDAR